MSEQQDEPAKKPRLNLTPSQVAASALAACCASIVASYLGVAGTVIGAAVGSVVATTGAAIWAHLFRRGGDRIKQTLLVNGQPLQVVIHRADAETAHLGTPGDAADAAVSAEAVDAPARVGRFYGATAEPTARPLWTPDGSGATRMTTVVANGRAADPDETAVYVTGASSGGSSDGSSGGSSEGAAKSGPLAAIRRYRKPIGVVMAIVAVFCVSITVGFLAGGPVRNVGSGSTPPAGHTTTSSTVRQTQGDDRQSQTSTGQSSGSASPGDSASSSASGTPSSSGSASPSTSPTPSASPSAQGGTGTSAAAGAATAGTPAGAANTATKTP